MVDILLEHQATEGPYIGKSFEGCVQQEVSFAEQRYI